MMDKNRVNPIPIHSIDQIDLDSHAVIEASAGTGKTYTIENLVIALLKSGRVFNLEEILVVTFTEKAAAEIRERIRMNITAALQNDPSDILQTSLDNFDSASMYTIHGFCNKLLQEYAFENDEQFLGQLIDDRAVYRQALYHLMREVWPVRYGEELQEVLRISRYPGETGSGMSSWENRVLDLALRYQPLANDALIPESGADLLYSLRMADHRCQAYLDELEQLIGPIDRDDITKSDFPARYASLNINKTSMGKRLRIINSIIAILMDRKTRAVGLDEINDFFSGLDLGEQGFHEFNTRWNKGGADYQEKLPHLLEVIALLEKLRALDIAPLQHALSAATVIDLKDYAIEYKKSKGLISYDDMVTRVYHALCDRSSILKKALQKKYRYALVDEFQDTDMLQWGIFSSLFLDSGQNRLFIIGDPKQSIYGFRGADVHAYYTARDKIIQHYNARYYCLDENWRSSPALISVYNSIFTDATWFSDTNIRYLPSRYPRNKNQDSHAGSKSLLVLDCGVCSGSAARYKAARYISREIKRIIAEDPLINLNEIAILVTKWKEAEIIEKYLKKEKINYSLYKKEGLFQSKEALEIQLLLSAIANPHDMTARKKSLITRFFRIQVRQLLNYSGAGYELPSGALFEKWINRAEQKQWPLLFQSFMEDTGIIYCSHLDDYDRAILNYRSILQHLEMEAYRNNYCIQDLADYCSGLRQGDPSSHDTYNIHAIDLDNPGIQILTIHASKGLQFRTVFIAGGYTQRTSSQFWTYHHNSRRIFDLVMNSANESCFDLETASDDERLFYVALTRAQDRLYIPLFQPGTRSKRSAGILGDKLQSALQLLHHQPEVTWVDIDTADETGADTGPVPEKPAMAVTLPEPLLPIMPHSLLDRKISIDSFSGLKSRLYQLEPADRLLARFGNQGSHADEDDSVYSLSDAASSVPEKAHDLPRSSETGIMLHAVLEQIDFQLAGGAADPSELLAPGTRSSVLIESSIKHHMPGHLAINADDLRKHSARIVWHTLNSPLDGSDLALRNLKKKLHEVEFYYPLRHDIPSPVPELSKRNGFMHGFIDMIFLYQDKYYIVDWKSNYIDEGYSSDQLERNIRDMHYDLQMKIYASAVLRWLKAMIPDYDYERHFGGIYYLYLRGMDIDDPRQGIYFYRPGNEDLLHKDLFKS